MLDPKYLKVKWRDWSPATLEEAQAQNKPIFLTVGYFACYWCHVMEEKVYEDTVFSDYINEHMIPIYVDKDERPDINEIYMSARQLITKQSGWPNHVFLTPDALPFMAAGVLQPERENNLLSLSKNVMEKWHQAEPQLKEAGKQISAIIYNEMAKGTIESDGTPNRKVAQVFDEYLEQHYDTEFGGFYSEPKFSQENYLLFLLSDFRHRNVDSALEMANSTLKHMAAGAIYDRVGGGFHRYCIDRQWRSPHFEKMLYNQALLSRCYSELSVLTNKPYHRDIATETLDFVIAEMKNEQGLFISAIDAETQGVEGLSYLWEEEQILKLLDKKEAELFAKCYQLEEMPTLPGHPPVEGKVLRARRHLVELANEKNRSYESLKEALKPILAKLKKARDARPQPQKDTKVIAGWNGLMIDSLARASALFDRADYLEIAVKAANTLCESMIEDTLLLRVRNSKIHGFLEDYAYVEAALLSLYKVTNESQWLDLAKKLQLTVDGIFWDGAKGGYFITDGAENLIVRIHKGHDSGLPAASGVMLHNLLRLWEITEDETWLARSRVIMAVYEKDMLEFPADYSTMVQAMLYLYEY